MSYGRRRDCAAAIGRRRMRDLNEKLDDPHARGAYPRGPSVLLRQLGDKLEGLHRKLFGAPPECTCQTSAGRCPRHG